MWCFRRRDASTDSTPFPYRQLFVLALCRISEPIAFMSIFPYVYYMIESFHITSDDRGIALYAGMVTSAFAFAEFLAGVIWGRLSDRFGRKPILLCGLAGTGISMIIFGFSQNLATALIARALGGILNGNQGVLQTTVAEVVTDDAHRPLGFSIMPVVWCIGSIVGSAIGGALADPVRNYGWSPDTIFGQYRFLLPNLVCTAVVVFGMIVGIFFLEETHEDLKDRKDYGVEAGKWFLSLFKASAKQATSSKRDYMEETLTLLHDEDLPDYRSAASSPQLSPTYTPHGLPPAYQSVEGSPRSSLNSDSIRDYEAARTLPVLSISSAFSRQVVLNIASYGILAYHTISAEQLLSVLFSMPATDEQVSLPFHFTGGFGLPTKSIGGILSVQGVIQVVATLVVFPPINRRLGSLSLLRITAFSYPFLYMLVPYLTLLPSHLRMACVYGILVWKVSAQAFAFPSTQIMLVNSAPSTKVLGTLNGAAASSASLGRALGPIISGLVQSAGLANGILGLPWWVNALIAAAGVAMTLFMSHESTKAGLSEKQPSPEHGHLLEDTFSGSQGTADLPNASLETLQATPTSPILQRFPSSSRLDKL
ncbi:hypothetical protein AMS68_003224 [Peltaster fructicola]|uniref:Major facilitator superfamily (MFS) profile domain-containing protein n=1 Tax=Peltaster fructicola TaxID=286661 RepID=A0A6H0XSG7_9PEZI|nr:hypothetical protein AMS68_003224 [Peltaster fructicola]